MDHITCVTGQHCQNKNEQSNHRQLPRAHDELQR